MTGTRKLNAKGWVKVLFPYSSKKIKGAKLRLRGVFSSPKFTTSAGSWSYFEVTG